MCMGGGGIQEFYIPIVTLSSCQPHANLQQQHDSEKLLGVHEQSDSEKPKSWILPGGRNIIIMDIIL